jgi:hypothetical protein
MEQDNGRGKALKIFAVLFVLIAISNLSKPFSGGRAGFVFLGTRTEGIENAILAPAFGIYQLVCAAGIWRRKRYAVPMAWAYAIWVPINMALFTMKTPQNWGSPIFGLCYAAVAIAVTWGTAILLTRRRASLE